MRGSCIVDSHDEVVTIVTIPVPNPVLSLSEERQLKQRIKELIRYRKNGVANAEDCSEFDMLRQDQERMKENRKLPDSDSQ